MGRQLPPGDTVQYIRGSQQLGLKKNTTPRPRAIRKQSADRRQSGWPARGLRSAALARVNVYTNLPCEFSTGDRIQFTHNNKDLCVHNRDRGRVEAMAMAIADRQNG